MIPAEGEFSFFKIYAFIEDVRGKPCLGGPQGRKPVQFIEAHLGPVYKEGGKREVTLVPGLTKQEGYPSSRIFLRFSRDVVTRQVWVTLTLG